MTNLRLLCVLIVLAAVCLDANGYIIYHTLIPQYPQCNNLVMQHNQLKSTYNNLLLQNNQLGNELKKLKRQIAATTPRVRKTAEMIYVDMSSSMQRDAVEFATQALKKYKGNKDIAKDIKLAFDKKYKPYWTCIVGRDVGSFLNYDNKRYIRFYLGQVKIVIFKLSGV